MAVKTLAFYCCAVMNGAKSLSLYEGGTAAFFVGEFLAAISFVQSFFLLFTKK